MVMMSMDKKLLFFLLRSRRSVDTGLSLLEVLVATMVVFFTIMGALNGVLYAAVFQIKAERQAQASFWIQQDLEQVKSLAASTTTPPSYASTCTGSPNSCCTTTISGTTVTGGFANALRTSSSLPSTTTPKTFVGKSYTMTRTASVTASNPQVLTLTYSVSNASDTSPLATLYTEVIPAAALSCP